LDTEEEEGKSKESNGREEGEGVLTILVLFPSLETFASFPTSLNIFLDHSVMHLPNGL
jgi:hypothetical protein